MCTALLPGQTHRHSTGYTPPQQSSCPPGAPPTREPTCPGMAAAISRAARLAGGPSTSARPVLPCGTTRSMVPWNAPMRALRHAGLPASALPSDPAGAVGAVPVLSLVSSWQELSVLHASWVSEHGRERAGWRVCSPIIEPASLVWLLGSCGHAACSRASCRDSAHSRAGVGAGKMASISPATCAGMTWACQILLMLHICRQAPLAAALRNADQSQAGPGTACTVKPPSSQHGSSREGQLQGSFSGHLLALIAAGCGQRLPRARQVDGHGIAGCLLAGVADLLDTWRAAEWRVGWGWSGRADLLDTWQVAELQVW